MGFLDSMVGELVRRETGFNATRLLRRIGTKRLVMMGGAALAGGMLAQKASQGGGLGSFLPNATGSVGGSAPGSNLPPVPMTSSTGSNPMTATPATSTSNLPPLPVPIAVSSGDVPLLPAEDLSAGQDASGANPGHSQELMYAIVRTMVAAALSDGALEAPEKVAIEGHLDESGLTEAQQSQVRRDLVIPPAPGELAGMLPEGEDPEVLLEFAVLVLRADGELEAKEMTWLQSLAELLGVEEVRRVELVKELAGDLYPEA